MPVINGTDAKDVLTGTSGNDTLNGLGGDDSLTVMSGTNELNGGNGNDPINADFVGIYSINGGADLSLNCHPVGRKSRSSFELFRLCD